MAPGQRAQVRAAMVQGLEPMRGTHPACASGSGLTAQDRLDTGSLQDILRAQALAVNMIDRAYPPAALTGARCSGHMWNIH